MNRLYLVRHGIAVQPGTPGIPDDSRPLTPKGERRARQVARGLRRMGVQTDRIVTSPLPRARRTAEILAAELGLDDQLQDEPSLRAGLSALVIRDWLAGRAEESLMLVGHNPAFSDLVSLLLGTNTNRSLCELGRAGVAALSVAADGSYQLDWLAGARLIRRFR